MCHCQIVTIGISYCHKMPFSDNSNGDHMNAIPGRYKVSLRGYRTFVPDALPPQLSLAPVVARAVEDATHLLGQVEMCRTLLPNADLLIYSSLRREALASSTIEGTIASPDELLQFQVSQYSPRAEVREVGNYGEALEWGVEQVKTMPLTTRLILGLHERLLQGVRGASTAGRFKDDQNRIGSHPNEPFEEAVFVPPPPEDVTDLIATLERYINLKNNEPRVVQCALTHYQFETIHPFNDGNGCVGRLLIILQMIQLGLLSAPLIYPSVYFERTRAQYYQRLQAVREQGAWNEWIGYFAEGIQQQCKETVDFTLMILALRQQLRSDIAHIKRRASVAEVLDAFFQEPVLSPAQLAQYANISVNAVMGALNILEAAGLVFEITGKQKRRVYACRPVLDAIFGPTRSAAASTVAAPAV